MSFVRRGSLWLAVALLLGAAFPAFGLTRRQLNEWTRLLRSDDPQERSSAATSLVSSNDETALKVLLEALQPDQPEATRVSVIKAFGVSGDDRASAKLIAALADTSDAVRQAAKSALRTIDTAPSVRLLEQAAADAARPLPIRLQAVNILGDLRVSESIQALIHLLSDRDEAIRSSALAALKSVTTYEFTTEREWQDWWRTHLNMSQDQLARERIDALNERISRLRQDNERLYKLILDDPKKQTDPAVLIDALTHCDSVAVKKIAIKWLAALKGDPVRAALVGALKETDASVRQAACDALGAQGDLAAAPALRSALKDAETGVRASAAHALGLLKAKDAVSDLCAMLSDTSNEVAVAAANALAELADPAALDPLMQVVSAPDTKPALYDAAANALAKIKDPRAVPILVKLLRSTKDTARWSAADALGGLGKRAADAVKPLSAVALKDPVSNNREAALVALSKIGDPVALDTLADALSDAEKRVSDQALRSLNQIADSDPKLYKAALDRLLATRCYAQADDVLAAAQAQLAANPEVAPAVVTLRAQLAAGLIAAQEWARARKHLEILVGQPPKEDQYIRELARCLFALPDYDALIILLKQTRKSIPDLADYSWQETARAVALIAAGNDWKKVVKVVNDLEKESPDLGGAVTGPKLRALRRAAQDKLALPSPLPGASSPLLAPG